MSLPRDLSGDAAADFLLGGGEMGARMREMDWSRTPLGPAETWPRSLKTSISIMLASRFAMVIAWGPQFRFFYNDRYRPVLGSTKHPGALGAPAAETFPEAWPFIGPLFESTRRGESVALGPIVEAAVDSMRPSADAKGVELKSIVDSGANIVLGDPNRIQQIVWNLLSNAVKFTPRGGRVQVALQRVSSHAEITVSDTGKGISPDFLPHVFERFRQADSSSTRKYGGLGLGLAIVRHLTELNGGSVDAFSDGEDQGATFTVRLPMAIIHDKTPVRHSQPVFPHAAQENTSALHSLSLEGIKVLAVDDEPDARYLLEVVLSHYNANVKVVASTSDALKVIQDWQPNVIISDIGMPGEDGYALIRKLRGLPADRGGNVPAAALTAYARSEDRVRAIAAGYQTHLTKPVEPSELVAVVASLAGRAGRT